MLSLLVIIIFSTVRNTNEYNFPLLFTEHWVISNNSHKEYIILLDKRFTRDYICGQAGVRDYCVSCVENRYLY